MTESQRYRLQMKATSKMLREYFGRVPFENIAAFYSALEEFNAR